MYWLPDLTRREFVWLGASALTHALVFFGLRVLVAANESLLDVSRNLSVNLGLSRGNLDLLVMLSLGVVVLGGLGRIPAAFRRMALNSRRR